MLGSLLLDGCNILDGCTDSGAFSVYSRARSTFLPIVCTILSMCVGDRFVALQVVLLLF